MRRGLLLFGLLFAGVTAVKADGVDSLRVLDIEQVVVTGNRIPTIISRSPVLTRVISANEISRLAPPSLEYLLEEAVSGVEFHQAGYGSSLSFQGLDARYVLFMVDGERLAGETYGNVDYTRIRPENIERIEIVKGASSVLYGSSAMGAVVNIITRMPGRPLEISASIRWASSYQANKEEALGGEATDADIRRYRSALDKPNLNGNISVGINRGKIRSLMTASLNLSDAYRLTGTQDELRHYAEMKIMKPQMEGGRPVMDPETGAPVFEVARVAADTSFYVEPDKRGLSVSGYKSMNISQKFDYRLNDKFRFEAGGSYFHKERYDFNTSISDDNPMSNNDKAWGFDTYRGYGAKALMEHSPNSSNRVFLSFSTDSFRRSLDSPSGNSSPKQLHVYYKPSFQWTRSQRKMHRLTVGAEILFERLNFDLDSEGYDATKRMSGSALYIQEEFFEGRPFSFDAGLRGEYNNRFGMAVTPTASAKYRAGNWVFRANYSRGYRAPSLKELYMEFRIPIPGAVTYIRGNDKLREESNHYISLSGEVIRPEYHISASVYRSYFRNKIDVVGSAEGGITTLLYDNVSKSSLSGAELLIKVRPTPSLEVSANYNYVYRKDNDDTPSQATQYIFPSPHTLVLKGDYWFRAKRIALGFSPSLRWVGGKHYKDFMPVVRGMSDYYTGTYTAYMKGYVTVDASVSAEYREFSLQLGVNNITGYAPSVVCFNSGVVPPRNLFVKLAFSM